MDFGSFNFHPTIASGIRALGYKEATPIQEQAIPHILSGRDVMALAQTGTGKTAVFVLPILQKLMNGPRGYLRALVVAPTRELAEQTHEFFVSLGSQTRLRSVTLYGGVGAGPQVARIKAGAEIAVACPGRLLDLVNQGSVSLSKVEILVLDEADRMFDMGFLPDIRRILRHVPQRRQTLLFSATMPDDIRRLAGEAMRNPVTVQIGHARPVDTVAHALYPVRQEVKTQLLMELLKRTQTGSVLIFTRTKHRAKKLHRQLESAGHKATSLQGNLSQNRRQASLEGFREGEFRIMVATDIAARGIDVSTISHVINYDMPDTADAYTHRIGRTGRAAKTGEAYTFVTGEDEEMVRVIERLLGEQVERRFLDGFDYNKQSAPNEFAREPRGSQQRNAPRRDGRQGGQSRQGRGHHVQRRDSSNSGPRGPPSQGQRSVPQPQQPGTAPRAETVQPQRNQKRKLVRRFGRRWR